MTKSRFKDVPNIWGLSAGEYEAVARLRDGFTVHEAARAMNLSVNTIETYADRARLKMGAKNRVQLVIAFDRWERSTHLKDVEIVLTLTNGRPSVAIREAVAA
jgi:DNA-binding NarL/FixJ family response regulator